MKQDNKQKLLDKHPEIKDKLKKLRFLAKYDIKTTIDAFERREINYLFVASQIQEIGYSKFDKSL